MTPEDKKFLLSLSKPQAIALTAYGEAEDQGLSGLLAVAFVIMNRHRLWAKGLRETCYSEDFECWHTANKRYPKLMAIAKNWDATLKVNKALNDSLIAAETVIAGKTKSIISLCTFYKTVGAKSPWFDGEIKRGKLRPYSTIKNHTFYIEKRFDKEL